MPRINLFIYRDPGQVEVFVNLLRLDGTYERLMAIIDTGAAISLFPRELLNVLSYRLGERGTFIIEQAGIANQSFEAIEAYITVFFEDAAGNRTHPTEILVWFAETAVSLVGFEGVLDRAVLHIDLLTNSQAWLELAQ